MKSRRTLPTRRQVLRGAAGFSLALPFLPSLFERRADAAPSPFAQPRFVAIGTEHGGLWSENMHPADSSLTETMSYGGHTIRRGDLVRTEANGRASLSRVCSADASMLSAALVAKMNVIRGLDVPFHIGHHRGGHLGNWGDHDGNCTGEPGTECVSGYPTIDQVLAHSPSFYPDLSGILERSLVMGDRISWGWANPAQPGGEVQELPFDWDSMALFNRIFVPDDPQEESNPRPPVVDRVLDNYRSLRQSNRRLSANDRQRLDNHLSRIDELQRRLSVAVSCGDIPQPTQGAQEPDFDNGSNPQAEIQMWQLFSDVIVAAFACGTSRIATMRLNTQFAAFAGDWHQDVVHQALPPNNTNQDLMVEANRVAFEGVIVDLINKLDQLDEGDGTTVLDNTLLQWTQESGPVTHDAIDLTVVTAGGAAGCLQTGHYIDYRNRQSEQLYDQQPGLFWNQYLATALQAMGLSPDDYEIEPGGGYPHLALGGDRTGYYSNATIDARGQWLPWLRA